MRTLIVPPTFHNTVTMAEMRAKVTALRDDMRTKLNNGVDWIVSDIAYYTGVGNSDGIDREGIMFMVSHANTGTPTNKDFVFSFLLHPTTRTSYRTAFSSDTEAATMFSSTRQGTLATTMNSNNFSMVGVHYNKTGVLPRFAFDNTSALTYTGGDYQELGVYSTSKSPKTDTVGDPDGFFTAAMGNEPFGLSFERIFHGNTAVAPLAPSEFVLVFDHDKPFVALYGHYGLHPYPTEVGITGDIVIPDEASDTYTQGTVCLRTEFNNAVSPRRQGTFLTNRASFLDESGMKHARTEDYTLATHTQYTLANTPHPGGAGTDYPWSEVVVSKNDVVKGIIDPDIMRIQGPQGKRAGLIIDKDGTLEPDIVFVKLHDTLVFPWVDGAPGYPPIPWGLKP